MPEERLRGLRGPQLAREPSDPQPGFGIALRRTQPAHRGDRACRVAGRAEGQREVEPALRQLNPRVESAAQVRDRVGRMSFSEQRLTECITDRRCVWIERLSLAQVTERRAGLTGAQKL